MRKKLQQTIKPLLKTFFVLSLVLALALGHADGALAARSGGRIGGGSFRAPSSRTYTPAPTRLLVVADTILVVVLVEVLAFLS